MEGLNITEQNQILADICQKIGGQLILFNHRSSMNPVIRKDLRRLLKRYAGRYLDAGLLYNVADPNKVRIVALGNHLVDTVFLSQDTVGTLLMGFLDHPRSHPLSPHQPNGVFNHSGTTNHHNRLGHNVSDGQIDLPGKRTHRQQAPLLLLTS